MKIKEFFHAFKIASEAIKQKDASKTIRVYFDEIKNIIYNNEDFKNVASTIKKQIDEYNTYLDLCEIAKEIRSDEKEKLSNICEDLLIVQEVTDDTTVVKAFINYVLPKLKELNELKIAFPVTFRESDFKYTSKIKDGLLLQHKRLSNLFKYAYNEKPNEYKYKEGFKIQERFIVKENGSTFTINDRFEDFVPYPININNYWNAPEKKVFIIKEDGNIGCADFFAIINNTNTFDPYKQYVLQVNRVDIGNKEIGVSASLIDINKIPNCEEYKYTILSDEECETLLKEKLDTNENIEIFKNAAKFIKENN